MDSSSGRSLIFLVGTGAAVGGIAVTVVGVILWRMTKRKCRVYNINYGSRTVLLFFKY